MIVNGFPPVNRLIILNVCILINLFLFVSLSFGMNRASWMCMCEQLFKRFLHKKLRSRFHSFDAYIRFVVRFMLIFIWWMCGKFSIKTEQHLMAFSLWMRMESEFKNFSLKNQLIENDESFFSELIFFFFRYKVNKYFDTMKVTSWFLLLKLSHWIGFIYFISVTFLSFNSLHFGFTTFLFCAAFVSSDPTTCNVSYWFI